MHLGRFIHLSQKVVGVTLKSFTLAEYESVVTSKGPVRKPTSTNGEIGCFNLESRF